MRCCTLDMSCEQSDTSPMRPGIRKLVLNLPTEGNVPDALSTPVEGDCRSDSYSPRVPCSEVYKCV